MDFDNMRHNLYSVIRSGGMSVYAVRTGSPTRALLHVGRSSVENILFSSTAVGGHSVTVTVRLKNH